MWQTIIDWWYMWIILGTWLTLLWVGDRVTEDDDVWVIVERDLAHEYYDRLSINLGEKKP